MGNIMDYVEWRGDLTFAQSPFNEVDNLILSCLSYVRLEGVDAIGFGQHRPLWQVSRQFFAQHEGKELLRDRSFAWQAPFLMQEMAKSRRFQDVLVGNYISIIEDKMVTQFAMLEIILGDGTSYLAFRGTDDTLTGWKEDFYLTKGGMPAGEAAVTYLNQIGSESSYDLRIGGHSKGGYLALYAAVSCLPEVQKKIIGIYSNDGPGYTAEFLSKARLSGMLSKFYRYIPEESIVGMLFEHSVHPVVVKSVQKGVLQHNGFTWEVSGPSFEYAEELSKKSKRFQFIFHDWLEGIAPEQREMVIEDFFAVLTATGASTLSEIYEGGFKNLRVMIKQIEFLHPETREIVTELIRNLMLGRVKLEEKQEEME